MALILSAASGNFNAGATWVGGIVPTVGDEARASTGHTITITANVTCTEVSNDGTGLFVLNSGVTLTANVTNKSTTVSRTCLQFTANSPAVGTIVGNVTSGPATSSLGINNVNTGTVSITGNVTAGSGSLAYGVYNSGTGTFSITGNVTGGSSTAHAVQNQGNGNVTITGNAIAVGAGMGVNNVGTGTITITGNSTGAGTHGVNNASTGIVTITGIATAGTFGTGVSNASTGTVYLGRAKANAYGPGNSTGLSAAAGANNAGLGIIEIKELEYGTFGMPPTTGTGIRLKKVSTNVAIFNYCDTAGAKTLIDATENAAMPVASDVRSGVSYASGAFTGSCAVPAAGSVAFGVPVDATSGTAVLDVSAVAAAVWGAASRTITGGTVTTLTNAPASVTPSDIWSHAARTLTSASGPSATDIRQELDSNSTKLANLDATVSSRLASAGYTAPTTPPTAAEIATAVEGSLLNEADGQAVLNAIVGAIGNQNLSQVSLVAAVRADLERTGGKLDSIPTTAAPTAAANATAVWSAATKTITGGTVDTLTNSPSVPSAASIASATRSELATELGRLDAAVSTRLATSGYTAPSTAPTAADNAAAVRAELATELARVDVATSTRLASSAYTAPSNSDVAAIKAKTDLLNTDRLAQCSTVATTGSQLAAALS